MNPSRARIPARLLLLALGTLCTVCVFAAQPVDLSGWQVAEQTHPDGVRYSQGEAALERYAVSALDAASAGGMSKTDPGDLADRAAMALSVVAIDVYDTEPVAAGTTIVTGTGYSERGEVRFAASFSSAAADETFNVFYAPAADYQRFGGPAVLTAAAPRGVGGMPETPSVPAASTRSRDAKQPAKPSSGAALLAGVRGDLDRMSTRNAEQRKQRQAEENAAKARAAVAQRERIYAQSGARKGRYPPLSNKQEYLAWPAAGAWLVQVPNDPDSPRYARIDVTGADVEPAAALRKLVQSAQLQRKDTQPFEKLESYASLDGRDARILLTSTRMNQGDGVAFAFYGRGAGSSKASLFVLEMREKTYRQWGGVAAMLRMRGVIDDIDVFPAAQRQRIANASLPRQIDFYEAVLDKFYVTQSLALMMTRARTTAMMMELNYDLLFGDDISSPFIAD